MLCRVRDRFIFLASEEVSSLEKTILDGQSRMEFSRQLFPEEEHWQNVWHRASERLHSLITAELHREAEAGWGRFWAKRGSFKFRDEDAHRSAFPLLHCYALATGQASLKVSARSLAESIHNRFAEGCPHIMPMGKHAVLSYSCRPLSWLQKKLGHQWDSWTELRSEDVEKIAGEVTRFEMTVDGVVVRFGQAVRIDLAP